jgi:hypothetical protein
MSISLTYQSGEEIRERDRVLLHGEPGRVESLVEDETRGVMIAESKVFGRLFLTEKDIADYEELVFVSRSLRDDGPSK